MNRRINILLIILILLFTIIQSSFAKGLFDDSDNTTTNWEESVVEAIGYGVAPEYIANKAQAQIMAREAAITMAQRGLLERIQGVQIDSEQIVKNAQVKSDIINKRVSGIVKGAQIIEEKRVVDNVYQVLMQVKFYGKDGIMKVILPSIEKESSDSLNDNQNYSEFEESNNLIKDDYTGVIINTFKVDVKAALAPKIYDDKGKLIYGISKVQSEGVIIDGVVGYNRSLADAKSNPRVGENPLILNAIKVKGRYKTDLVLTTKDARTLEQAGKSNNIFAKCKVVIVLN